MNYFITTVTQKGQVTLPKSFRQDLNIMPYDKVKIEVSDNFFKISPVKDLLSLAGTFKPRKNIDKSPEVARDTFENQYQRS